MSKPELLFLAHRIPYPPNKGDKLRTFHFLKFLGPYFKVHLGCFYDDPEDEKYISELSQFCESVFVLPINPMLAKAKSMRGLVSGKALTLEYYYSKQLQSWVDDIVSTRAIHYAVVFSSAVAQYIYKYHDMVRVIDFIDIDSDKWHAYSESKSWPFSWVFKRESEFLSRYEEKVAREFNASCFVSETEALIFSSRYPDIKNKIHFVNNGVDYQYFSPEHDYSSPYNITDKTIVFTGAMDYWPNIDAVNWFADEIFPLILEQIPELKLYIVGSNPVEKVKQLSIRANIMVTGRVDDIRAYISEADLIVATLRIARGVQNKVLEAMALNKPLLVTTPALEGIIHNDKIKAFELDKRTEMVAHAIQILMGQKKNLEYRELIKQNYDWEANTEKLKFLLMSS